MKKKLNLNSNELNLYQSNEHYEVLLCKDRKEWLQSRLGCIGASDASCILDKNPFRTLDQLIEDKITLNIKDSQKGVMKYGQDNEALIRDLFRIDYRTKYEVEYVENCQVYSKEYPFLSCSPDSLLREIGRKMQGRKGILEIKTAYCKSEDDLVYWDNVIPEVYYIQVLHQLLVMKDLDFVVLRAKIKVYKKSTKEYYYLIKDYHIERKTVQADIDYLLEKELEFKETQENIIFRSIEAN